MKLIAITELRYAAVNYFPGDEFEGSDNDAMLLKAIGKAKDAAAVATKSARLEEPVARPSPAAAPVETSSEVRDDKPTGRRRYMRRDMTAAED